MATISIATFDAWLGFADGISSKMEENVFFNCQNFEGSVPIAIITLADLSDMGCKSLGLAIPINSGALVLCLSWSYCPKDRKIQKKPRDSSNHLLGHQCSLSGSIGLWLSYQKLPICLPLKEGKKKRGTFWPVPTKINAHHGDTAWSADSTSLRSSQNSCGT